MVRTSRNWRAVIEEATVSAFLFRLGRSSARHPFRVLGIWLAAAVAVVALQGAAGGEFDDTFRVPGVESQQAADVLQERFPSHGGQTARIVLHADGGRLDNAERAVGVDRVRQALSAGEDVSSVSEPALTADGQTAYVDVSYLVDHLTGSHHEDVVAAAASGEDAGVETELTGALALLGQDDPSSELIGLGVAIIVLLVAFGSVVAMGLPIVTALVGLFIGGAAVGILSALMDVPEFSLILCMMVGLGVGIDYALFIVTRHRQNLAEGMLRRRVSRHGQRDGRPRRSSSPAPPSSSPSSVCSSPASRRSPPPASPSPWS